MTTTGAKLPSSGTSVARSTATAWTNPSNITANDGTTASISSGSTGSAYLVGSNFGFAIPTGSVITGVRVIWDVAESATGTEAVTVQLQSSSTTLIGATRSFTASGNTLTLYTVGSLTDLWGATLTPAIINDAGFGVRMWFTTTHAMTVDYVSVEVDYTPPVSGSLVATETGLDAFSSSGKVIVSGSLVCAETGNDTFSATGSVSSLSAGTLAATETGTDTFASSGSVVVSGALSVSEVGSDLFDSQGSAIPNDTVGDLHGFEQGDDSFASSGNVIVSGQLQLFENNDEFTALGTVLVQGSFATSEVGEDIMDSQGSAIPNDTVGDLHGFEAGDDSFISVGNVLVSGSFAVTEASNDSFIGVGNVDFAGALNATEASDIFSASGGVVRPIGIVGYGLKRSKILEAAKWMLELLDKDTVKQTAQIKKVKAKLKKVKKTDELADLQPVVQDALQEVQKQKKLADDITQLNIVINELKLLKAQLEDEEEALLMLIA